MLTKTPMVLSVPLLGRTPLGTLYPFRVAGDVLDYEESDTLVYEFLLCTSLSPSLTTGGFTEFPRQFERLATVLTANFLGPNTGYWP